MDSRRLAALLASIVSQFLLFLLSPSSSNPLSLSSDSNSNGNTFSLLQRLLSFHELATSRALLSISTRKRKRTHLSESDSDQTQKATDPNIRPEQVKLCLTRCPDSFRTFFKMKSETFEWLLSLLEPLLECRDPIGSRLTLSAELRLGIGLYRLSSGSDYSEIATRFGVTESVTRFCTKQLCRVLCTNFRFWVGFPNPEELKSVTSSFEKMSGLPNCCGVVDCTRFKILEEDLCKESPKSDTIAVQIVVDSSSRILSIVAGFRGNRGDSEILKLSTLCKDIEERKVLNLPKVNANNVGINQYLIGDGGYPLLPWLMVPFVDAVANSREKTFNAALSSMQAPALKTIASLKNWGVLQSPIRDDFKSAVGLIGACSILFNVLLMREDDSMLCRDYLMPDSTSQDYEDVGLDNREASVVRNALAVRAQEFHDLKHCDHVGLGGMPSV